jgi:hypothetical protein
MKKLYFYIFLSFIFFTTSAIAQITYPGSFEDYHLQIVDLKSKTKPAPYSLDERLTMGTPYSPNGIVFTPKGDIKVLIICAGFGEPYDSYEVPGWNAGVNTLPEWVNNNSAFYRNNTDFNNPATVNDKGNISRFYYEMSKGIFRMTADVYPTRININASGSGSWGALNKKVIEKMKLDNPIFNWSPYDGRTNSPNYLVDNSSSTGDLMPDFVVIVYRYQRELSNTSSNWYINPPVTGMHYWTGSGGGYAAIDGLSGVNYNGYSFDYSGGYTHCSGTSSIFGLFIHEVAHSVFDCPHYANANGIVGNYFYNQMGGWGMMNLGGAPFGCANGWERWYLGWIELNSNGVTSDVKSAADLPVNGEFILRDFITTGDVVRIKIPNGTGVDQFLWLENHQGKSIYDDRGWSNNNGCTNNSLPSSARGLVAYVESIAGDRNNPFDFWGDTYTANGIKPIHSKGNYDYSFLGPSESSCILWGNPIYNILEGSENPISGQNRTEGIRLDYNNNNDIALNAGVNNQGSSPNETHWVAKRNGNMTYDFLGYDINFVVGQKLGISSNPALINRPIYNSSSYQMSPFYLNGISVLVSSVLANGDVKIKISYNDVAVNSNVRWTGNIILPDVTNTINPDLDLFPNYTLTINKSGTSNRHTKTTSDDFINPTTFTCSQNSYFKMQNNSKTIIDNSSTLILDSGSTLEINDGAQLIIENGSKLEVKSGATIIIKGGGGIIVKCFGTLCVNPGAILNLQDFSSCIHLIGDGSLSSNCQTNLASVITGNGSVQNHNNPLSLSGSTISSDNYYSGTTITSTNVTIQGIGTDVVYDVSSNATINSNFTVPFGSTFEVRISSTSCTNASIR